MSAYVIQQGDTLFSIAQAETGNGNRYTEILPLNPQISNPDVIVEGAMIQLPDSWNAAGAGNNLPATVSAPAVTPTVVSTSTPATSGPSANAVLSGTLLLLLVGGGAFLLYRQGAFNEILGRSNPEEGEEEAEDFEEEDNED